MCGATMRTRYNLPAFDEARSEKCLAKNVQQLYRAMIHIFNNDTSGETWSLKK